MTNTNFCQQIQADDFFMIFAWARRYQYKRIPVNMRLAFILKIRKKNTVNIKHGNNQN